MTWAETIMVQRGYNRRHRQEWSIARWQTYYLMSAQVGSKGMREAGLHKPTDLLKFPWEKEQVFIDNDEVARLQAEMAEMNRQGKNIWNNS